MPWRQAAGAGDSVLVFVRLLLVMGMDMFMMTVGSRFVLVVMAVLPGVVAVGVFMVVGVGMLVHVGVVMAVRLIPVRVDVLVVVPVLVLVFMLVLVLPFHASFLPS